MDNKTYHDFGISIAKQAGLLAVELKRQGLEIFVKEDGTKCTNADKAVERFLKEEISSKFQEHGIIGEEYGVSNGGFNQRFTWVKDPIDGTGSYIRNEDTWAVNLAICDNKIPIVGIVYNPIKNQMISSYDNKVILNDNFVDLKQDVNLADTKVRGFLNPKIHKDGLSALIKMNEDDIVSSVKGLPGSPAYGFAGLALGEYEIYIMGCRREPAPEDFPAGIHIVRNLEGLVTDENGADVDPFKFSKYIIASTNPALHEDLLEKLKEYKFGSWCDKSR